MHIRIEKFVVGSILGFVVPISLVWAQYIHPLNFPKVSQLEQIPSKYLLNIPLGNSLKELEKDSEWIELQEEAFYSDYQMQTTNLIVLKNSYEDFRMPEGFKDTKPSSILQQNSFLNPSNKSSHHELDHTFAITNLIKNSLQSTASTPINNPIDPNLTDSTIQDEILIKIETYTQHAKVFLHESLLNQTENSETSVGKTKDKHPNETLSYKEVLTSYPEYSVIPSKVLLPFFNIFDHSFSNRSISTPEISQLLTDEPTIVTSRQRRVAFDSSVTYVWEIEDFSTFDFFDFDDINTSSGNSFNIYIYPSFGKNSGTDGFDFNSANQKTMASVISGYDTIQTNKLFMTESVTGESLSFNIDDSLWQYVHMDWAGETSWSVSNVDNNYYLNYDPNGFKLSPVPEPSTYFMTGILFCFIGCNRSSRNTIKTFLSKIFMHWKTKDNTEDIQDRIS